jgi:hypothetical protein
MIDSDRYRGRANICAAHARSTNIEEVRELWLSLESSYRFLLRRAERIETESEAETGNVSA